MAYVRIMKSVYFSLDSIVATNLDRREEYFEAIFLLVSLWTATVSRVMQRIMTQELVDDIDRHVKLLLT